MANQIQATVYLVDNTLQAEPFAMSFFTSNISIRSGSSSLSGSVNSVIQYYYSLTNPSEYKEYYVSETIDTLVAAAGNTQVQCTVLNINGTSQVSGGIEFSFPAEQISIFPSTGLFTDVNAYILFKGNKFYTDDTVDTLKATANVGDYKVYTALLTQTGTDAPVATVLQNTLGGTPVWEYNSTGNYSAVLSGVFTSNTICIQNDSYNYCSLDDSFFVFRGNRQSDNEFVLLTFDNSITMLNGVLEGFIIEIRVVP